MNKLNDLDAKSWLKFTKTWFIHNPPPRKKAEKLHPAKYPEGLIEEFIRFFTKKDEIVLDPFLGTGSTLVAAHQAERNGFGVELMPKYAEIAQEKIKNLESQKTLTEQKNKQQVIIANSLEIDQLWQKNKFEKVDFVITSPPYGPMLKKKALAAKKREQAGLDVSYGEDKNNLENTEDYEDFLNKLCQVFFKIKPLLKENKYLVVIIQNYMDGPDYRTLAWDLGKKLSQEFTLKGERLWLQDNKTLYPYGYRYSFVPNVHHHYCLIFKNDKHS